MNKRGLSTGIIIGIAFGVLVLGVVGYFIFIGGEISVSEKQDANIQEADIEYFINDLGMYELPFSLFQHCMDENPDIILQSRCIGKELDKIREGNEETSDKCFYTCMEWKECTSRGLQGRSCIFSNCGYASTQFSKSGGEQRECQYEGNHKPGTSKGITENCGELGQQCCMIEGGYASIITYYYCNQKDLVCNKTISGSCVECGGVGEECCILESYNKSYYQCDNDMTCTRNGCFACGKEDQDSCGENYVMNGINVIGGKCIEGLKYSNGKCVIDGESSEEETQDPCADVPDDEYYICYKEHVKDMSCVDDLNGFICESSQRCIAETFPTADTNECCLMGCQ